MVKWFAGENGYSDAEIRSMMRRIEAERAKAQVSKSAVRPANRKRKPVKKAA